MDKLEHEGRRGKRWASGDESTFIRDPEPNKFTLTLVLLHSLT
jgi:hypothetical protein